MTAEIDVTVVSDPVRGIPVPLTAVDVTPIQGPCILSGWSLREAAGELALSAEGSVTSPGATATIAATASAPAGTYTINWSVSLAGTVAAGDANNFSLVDATGTVVASLNAGAVGNYPQPAVNVTTTAVGTFSVHATLAGTVGAIYGAEIDAAPALGIAAVVELQDSGQPLAEIALDAQASATETLPDIGLHVSGQVKVHVIQGAVTGVLYARFDKQS